MLQLSLRLLLWKGNTLMVFIIITLVVALITGIVTTFMNELVLGGLYDMVFHADEMMTQCTGVNFFTTVSDMAFSLALSLMVLKFLKKGFDLYVLWTDGNPDTDPTMLLVNFVKAIATALMFRWIYDIFVEVCDSVTTTLLTQLGAETNYTATVLTGIASLGIVPVLACLVFFIFYLILLFLCLSPRRLSAVLLECCLVRCSTIFSFQ